MRIRDGSSDVCSSDLDDQAQQRLEAFERRDLAQDCLRQAQFQHFGIADAQRRIAAECRKDATKRIVAARLADVAELRAYTATDTQQEQQLISRSEEHTSEIQSLMRISNAVFCMKKNNTHSCKPSIQEDTTQTI